MVSCRPRCSSGEPAVLPLPMSSGPNSVEINQCIVGENGAIIGLGQCVGQVGKNRLGVETSVTGLYLCGAESGGTGVGIELAIHSAYELLNCLGEKDDSWKIHAVLK